MVNRGGAGGNICDPPAPSLLRSRYEASGAGVSSRRVIFLQAVSVASLSRSSAAMSGARHR